ncbi:MAG: cobalamin biosynthesis protein [Nitrososphaerota archaeon]|jgi:adenosylcobinamide-phosphate synthase|nr:cobalamin biosynthesis protein [Nitrososphaerota archaeon]
MFQLDYTLFTDAVLIFALAFLLDVVLGEIPDRIHPTVGIGKVIGYLRPRLRNKKPKVEKINGVLLLVGVAVLASGPVFLGLFVIRTYASSIPYLNSIPHIGSILYIIIGAVLFKSTFAIKCMRRYTVPIAKALKKGDLNEARKYLPFIVRRDPNSLNEEQIISAAVESIAESTTDGITGPFFFFAFLGVPGAFIYRVINTLDSMVAYKTPELRNIGWFSAKMDTYANYIPARLTSLFMIIAAGLVGENAKESWRIWKRDKNSTASPNAGYTIGAMAGALETQLSKPGYYTLGDKGSLTPEDIFKALRIMEITSLLFGLCTIIIPIIALNFLIATG